MEVLKKILKFIGGLALVAIGVSAIAFPGEAFANLSMIWAILFLVGGIAGIITFFMVDKDMPGRGIFLVLGIMQTLLGISLVSSGILATTMVALTLCQIWTLFAGIEFIVTSFEEKRYEIRTWWLTLILGILMLLIGMSTFTSFVASTTFLPIMIGMGVIISGFAMMINAFNTDKANKAMNRM